MGLLRKTDHKKERKFERVNPTKGELQIEN